MNNQKYFQSLAINIARNYSLYSTGITFFFVIHGGIPWVDAWGKTPYNLQAQLQSIGPNNVLSCF